MKNTTFTYGTDKNEDDNSQYCREKVNKHKWKHQRDYKENDTSTEMLVNNHYLHSNCTPNYEEKVALDTEKLKSGLPIVDNMVPKDKISDRYDSKSKPKQFVETLEKEELHLLEYQEEKKEDYECSVISSRSVTPYKQFDGAFEKDRLYLIDDEEEKNEEYESSIVLSNIDSERIFGSIDSIELIELKISRNLINEIEPKLQKKEMIVKEDRRDNGIDKNLRMSSRRKEMPFSFSSILIFTLLYITAVLILEKTISTFERDERRMGITPQSETPPKFFAMEENFKSAITGDWNNHNVYPSLTYDAKNKIDDFDRYLFTLGI